MSTYTDIFVEPDDTITGHPPAGGPYALLRIKGIHGNICLYFNTPDQLERIGREAIETAIRLKDSQE